MIEYHQIKEEADQENCYTVIYSSDRNETNTQVDVKNVNGVGQNIMKLINSWNWNKVKELHVYPKTDNVAIDFDMFRRF